MAVGRVSENEVHYVTEFQGSYKKVEWLKEREFIKKAYNLGMINKIFYNIYTGGRATQINNKRELEDILMEIDDSFEKKPEQTMNYSVGMSLRI